MNNNTTTLNPKKQCLSVVKDEVVVGGGGGGGGKWESLNPEILALIFTRLSAEERVGVLPVVCKSFAACVHGPYCWAEIDIDQWCRKMDRTGFQVDSAVRRLVRRTRGTVRRLSAFKVGDPGFAYVANCGRFLRVLQIPMSDVTDKMVERHAISFENMAVLDISYCLKITCKGLESFGKNCKTLVHLRRNMPLPEVLPSYNVNGTGIKPDDSEAMIIADTMPGLQHLELCYGRFGDDGLEAILAKCTALTHLDIRGCWSVKLDGDLEDRCYQLQEFKSPWHDEFDSVASSGSDSDGANADVESSSDED
ncbi:hypothetical protein SO802_018977 [Lithocarpus litseifolius]|uniref:F-box domain-containing protein n=1 Tax=Lithocarpus litseifolius TaxID=425828 RepID=A0AAW2CQ87_9ROSI